MISTIAYRRKHPTLSGDPGSASVAIDTATSYREHAHRSLMSPDDEARESRLSLAFWPTRRHQTGPTIEPPILNCQRCGDEIAPSSGWWCGECFKVIWYIQAKWLMSMVQIAHSGEYDPPWALWIQDVAPWMIAGRIDTIRDCERALLREERRPVPASERGDSLHQRLTAHSKFQKYAAGRWRERLAENYRRVGKLRPLGGTE